MTVQLLDDKGNLVWQRGEDWGLACRSYLTTGMQAKIVAALKSALVQAKAESSTFDVVDGVLDVSGSAAQIKCDVPGVS